MERTCKYCGITKPLDQFELMHEPPRRHSYRCRACARVKQRAYEQRNAAKIYANRQQWVAQNTEHLRAYKREWSQDNIEKTRTSQREWVLNNPERRKAIQRKYTENSTEKRRLMKLRINYGVDAVTYQAMWDRQQGCCAICSKLLTLGLGHNGVTMDHDHTTGAVRDLLCRKCNSALGLAEDDPALLRKMADYLERHG